VSPGWVIAASAAGLGTGPLQRWLVFTSAVPAGQPRRNSCPVCGHAVAAPLRPPRAIWLTGTCPGCRSRVAPRPLLPEAATAAVLALLATRASSAAVLAALALLATGTMALAVIDATVRRLPDRLTLPLAAGVTGLLTLAAAITSQWGSLLRAVLAGIALSAFYLAILLTTRTGLGPGDAKLALPLGTMLGWYGWPLVLGGTLFAFLGAGAYALALLITRRASSHDSFPFGPFMAAGALVAILGTSPAASRFP
jgi:leader peptidase (prepilin peptidase) / N-methyltransferase